MKRILKTLDGINKSVPTVLIVEDHPSLRDSLYNGLKRYNYNVLTARKGEEIIARLGQEPVHVVLLDLILPQMSGFDVLRHIQQRRKDWDGFPFVIVITGADTPENESRAEELGADEFLSKPVTIEEVAERLEIFRSRFVFTDSGFQIKQP